MRVDVGALDAVEVAGMLIDDVAARATRRKREIENKLGEQSRKRLRWGAGCLEGREGVGRSGRLRRADGVVRVRGRSAIRQRRRGR